jgi:cobalt-zinc-cadmium efflux system protein
MPHHSHRNERTHSHGPGHQHGHSHALPGNTDQRRIATSFVVIITFMVIEIVGGIYAHSLALLADAGHMVSDAAALGMSWLAIHIGKRPADTDRSYGYQRLEVLAAFLNGCSLFVIAGWFIYEAIGRFAAPPPVQGDLMMIVAVAGLLANAVALYILNSGNRDNLNLRSAWLHVMGDLLGSVAAIVAAGVILGTGWTPIDPLLSVLVALLILKSAYEIVRSSAHILLEGTPDGVDIEAMRSDLTTILPPGADVHHVHVWCLTAQKLLVTLHVRSAAGTDAQALISTIDQRLRERFGIEHSTIQVETSGCNDDYHV